MLKVLIPVDGSRNACAPFATRSPNTGAITSWSCTSSTSSRSLSRHIARFVGRRERAGLHADRADAAMASASALVDPGAACRTRRTGSIGDRAEEICRIAARLGVHHIVMGTARKNSITRMLEDSVTHRVLETTPVPVEVITGDAVSRWERWGLPAGVLGAGGLLLLAID